MSSVQGFSKLSKQAKLEWLADSFFDGSEAFIEQLQSYWHDDKKVQKLFDEFSENTITNFVMPFGIAPNFKINDKLFAVPMVIEESSVVAAASKSAKFWMNRGGYKAEIVETEKIGQVHFQWEGDYEKLQRFFEELKPKLIRGTHSITRNMEKRGGGILDIELVDMRHEMEHYYQLKGTFETCDSMGANFINSVLEKFAAILKEEVLNYPEFTDAERDVYVIMSILSNYTPNCLVRVWNECSIEELGTVEGMPAEEFADKFARAIKVAQVDVHRATTHNKGVFNGIDAVILATGNDFRAVEACGHTYAARSGKYQSLTSVDISNGRFKFMIEIPLAVGTVGGLTGLHPLAKRSLEMLGNPSAQELMMIAAAAGLANNFGAIKSLTTTGIQKGHMKMHLLNILNSLDATQEESAKAHQHFEDKVISYPEVRNYLISIRTSENKPEFQ